MNYNEWARLIERKINHLLAEVRKEKGALTPPLDLESIREKFKVIAVEERPMIPEAAIEPTPGGFKVYLQSNFADQMGTKQRRRFSLAHEFCHTFFYDTTADPPHPISRPPAANKREVLCHRGAGLLLAPTHLLQNELKSLGARPTGEKILELADIFEVSVEVILRRLQEIADPPPVDHAIVFVGPTQGSSEPHVLAAYCGPWILSHFDAPNYGVPFGKWLGSKGDVSEVLRGNGFQRRTPVGCLLSSGPLYTSKKKFLLDIRLELDDQD